ncbi:hypothetical protein LMG8520_1095 [Lactococcus lactis subsp. lactis]|uniref:Uncharacterized protein n=1 Tax=Lactococcus lactis subsp. lactis TaxID=1360 RepID=A0A0V8DAL9_LACLL|nr:hypothetical protein LMG8520_1095 [Lactococcus lactis subsp. lactis]
MISFDKSNIKNREKEALSLLFLIINKNKKIFSEISEKAFLGILI